MTSEVAPPPSVSWAQRSSEIYLTFNVECEKPDIKIDKEMLSFKGICTPEKKLYEVEIPLYSEINPEKSTTVNKGRMIEVVLVKENVEKGFWPFLTSDKKKHHWLKVNFDRWQDEYDSGEEYLDNFDSPDENYKDDSSSAEEDDLPDLE